MESLVNPAKEKKHTIKKKKQTDLCNVYSLVGIVFVRVFSLLWYNNKFNWIYNNSIVFYVPENDGHKPIWMGYICILLNRVNQLKYAYNKHKNWIEWITNGRMNKPMNEKNERINDWWIVHVRSVLSTFQQNISNGAIIFLSFLLFFLITIEWNECMHLNWFEHFLCKRETFFVMMVHGTLEIILNNFHLK